MKLIKQLITVAVVTTSLALTACSSTAGQKTGQYVDDSVITTKVKAVIFDNPSLKTNEISVETYHGEVQLSGFVKNPQSIPLATKAASGVAGVKSVKNNLIVK